MADFAVVQSEQVLELNNVSATFRVDIVNEEEEENKKKSTTL